MHAYVYNLQANRDKALSSKLQDLKDLNAKLQDSSEKADAAMKKQRAELDVLQRKQLLAVETLSQKKSLIERNIEVEQKVI